MMRNPYEAPNRRPAGRQVSSLPPLGFPTSCTLFGAGLAYWSSRVQGGDSYREAAIRSAEQAPAFVITGCVIGFLVGLYCERLAKLGERRLVIILLATVSTAVVLIRLINEDL